ncbi:MAG: ABC transporter substrate-binding protein [Candidatus Dojkabacteria bacterium]|jgi:multiple sugar transport system substrate-binding protein
MDIQNTLQDKKKLPLIIAAVVLILVILIAFLILFFGKKKTTVSPSGGGTTQTRVSGEIVYWGLWEAPEVMRPLIEEFEQKNPGTTIKYSKQPFTQYESRLHTRLQQGATTSEPAPDVFRIHNTWLPKYASLLSTMPTSVMTRDEYSQKFYPTALSDFTGKDGVSIYAVPIEIDGLMVFYNKQLLAEQNVQTPPEDWDSFISLARKLTKKDSSGRIIQSGLALGSARNIQHSSEIILFLLLQEGVDLMDSTRTKISLNNSKTAGVFQTYVDFATGNNAVWSPSLNNDLNMFYSGKLAMMIAPSWKAFDIIQSSSSIEFGTSPLPQLQANKNQIYYSTYWAEAVNKKSPNTELAWRFVKFLAEKEQQLKLYSSSSTTGDRAFGEPYSLVELNEEMKGKAYVDAIAKMAPYMRSWQLGDESFVRSSIEEAITRIVESGKDVNSVLRETENTINNRLAQTNQ